MIQDSICPSLVTGIVEQRTVRENLHLPLLLLVASDNVTGSFIKLCPH